MKCVGIIFAAMTLACSSQLGAQECQPGSLGGAASFFSSYGGNNYEFCVTHETLENTPSWFNDDDDPPLSPRGAARSAKSELSALVNNAEDWRMSEIHLVPVGSGDEWVYVVSFVGPGTSPYGGLVPEFRIPVLMDGTAVTPQVSRVGDKP